MAHKKPTKGVAACIRCGSTNLKFLNSFSTKWQPAGFVLPGVCNGIAYCPDCDFEGIPIHFDDEKELDKYRRDLVKDRELVKNRWSKTSGM